MNSSQNNDEIDLRIVIKALKSETKNALRWVFRSIIWLLLLTRRTIIIYYKLLIVFLVAGFLLSFVRCDLSDRYFSSARIESRYLKGFDLKNSILNLNNYCNNKETAQLAANLNLSFEQASMISQINIYSNYENDLRELNKNFSNGTSGWDSLLEIENRQSQFTITATLRSKDQNFLPLLEAGILNYLKKNPRLNAQYTIQRENLAREKKSIEKQIVELTKFKDVVSSALIENYTPGSSSITLNLKENEYLVKPLEIYYFENTLMLRLIEIEKSLLDENKVSFITGFNSYLTESWKNKITMVWYYPIIGFVCGMVLSLVFQLNKFLRRQEIKMKSQLQLSEK